MAEIGDIIGPDEIRTDESAAWKPDSYSADYGGTYISLIDGEEWGDDVIAQVDPGDLEPGTHFVTIRASDDGDVWNGYTEESKQIRVVASDDPACDCGCECTCGGCCYHGD